ncbi:hypothetical protein ACJIZ3_009732 [Penstemon smallii]|uniref:Uncharacterized protein n=1 Tax=Penstemon smallii TaxID=265156 RepID=A0ABD3TDD4_9LAMI
MFNPFVILELILSVISGTELVGKKRFKGFFSEEGSSTKMWWGWDNALCLLTSFSENNVLDTVFWSHLGLASVFWFSIFGLRLISLALTGF